MSLVITECASGARPEFLPSVKILNMLSEVQTYVKICNIPVFQKNAASDSGQGRCKSAEYQHNLKWENAWFPL
jgi:hypothetical protein